MKKLFGTDGIRGEVNTELSAELAYLTGLYSALVLAETKGKRKCTAVIGKDTRISCDMLEAAFTSGALSVGVDIISVGIVPTPAIPHLVKEYKADFGVMISASHNPYNFNGIKLFNNEGFKLSDEIEEKIESLIQKKELNKLELDNSKIGKLTNNFESYKIYENILIKNTDLDLSGIKIALDCANGSNYLIAPDILRRLGATVFVIGNDPDGLNINKDCGSTSLDRLKDLVKLNKADIGIAFDGDADRVLALDENAEIIDGDRIILAIAKDLKKKNLLNNNKVVVTVMSNMGIEKALKQDNIDIVRTKVGDRYVLEEMINNNYSLGGEQSGHIIIRDLNTTGDGLSAALKLLSILKNDVNKASDINKMMTSFPQTLINVKVPNNMKYKLAELKEIKIAIKEVEDKLEGNGRVLLRASGTEPLLRVMVEGKNEKEIENFANYLVSEIKKII